MSERPEWMTARTVTHAEAHEAARRLINSRLQREDGARIAIPANPDRDDDLVLMAYIHQREAAEPTDTQVEAFGNAFYGDFTQWRYSKRQQNGIADGVRRGLRAAFAVGVRHERARRRPEPRRLSGQGPPGCGLERVTGAVAAGPVTPQEPAASRRPASPTTPPEDLRAGPLHVIWPHTWPQGHPENEKGAPQGNPFFSIIPATYMTLGNGGRDRD